MCSLSLRHCDFLWHVMKKMVELAYLSGGPLTAEQHRVLNSFPQDTRTVFQTFDVECNTTSYVCCPKCFKCYAFDSTTPDSYPLRCTHHPGPDSPVCNRTLRKVRTIKGVDYSRPTRLYMYNDMKSWVGRLISRPGMEDVLDRKYTPSLAPETAPEGFCDDILGSEALREFLGPDKKTPFLASSGNLVFSLSMDGFNPYRNSEAGKKVSVGAIFMVCLNLPPEIRYRFENMYLVGIIPGPSEASVDQINHLLKPLVDDLIRFWDPGMYYSHTPNHPAGRRIRCAVVPLICDLPAARQMSGFASFGATQFCSMCMQTLRQMDDTDTSQWERRTWQHHSECAEKWRTASTDAERVKLVRKSGVRWSQLLELPYWDPTRFTLVDSMHSFFLIDIRRHCRDIWGMDVNLLDGDGAWIDPGVSRSSLPSDFAMKRAYHHLRISPSATLERENTLSVLQQLCRETDSLPLPRYMKKKFRLVQALEEYVSRS